MPERATQPAAQPAISCCGLRVALGTSSFAGKSRLTRNPQKDTLRVGDMYGFAGKTRQPATRTPYRGRHAAERAGSLPATNPLRSQGAKP